MTDTDGGGGVFELAMFPLGTVLLPGMALPLRVFEPRYRVMMSRVLSEPSPRFGVVMIERGSEVGGGDTRTEVGCIAAVHAAEEMPDGQLAVVAAGSGRIVVRSWLPDDPHPRAMVEEWPDRDDPGVPDADLPDRLEALTSEVLELSRAAAELTGRPVEQPRFSDDPWRRAYELATVAPLGPMDRQSLLAAPGLPERVQLLGDLVHEQHILIEARRRFGEE